LLKIPFNLLQFYVVFLFHLVFLFILMDQIASYVLTIPIEKNMIFTIFLNFRKLTFVLCFSSTPISLGFFSTTLYMSCSSKNWYMYVQHHVEQQFQLTHPVGFSESL
jgi:hypothetical protein